MAWDAVRESFDQMAGMASEADIGLQDHDIQVLGDMAYELGVEFGKFKFAGHEVSLAHRVTNIYKRETGGWKGVHHHTDTSPAMHEQCSGSQGRAGRRQCVDFPARH